MSSSDPPHLREIRDCFVPLQILAAELAVPLACLRLDRHGRPDKKTFFSTKATAKPWSSLFPTNPSGHPPSPDLDPEHANARSEIDEIGGKTIFGIGSLVKILINLVYCILICQKEYGNLSWGTKVFQLYNELCDARNEPRIPVLERNPTLKELLLHKNGFAPMTRFLLAPDGTFMVSESEFLKYAAPFSDHWFRIHRAGSFNYSNGNHIFAALLLEKIVGRSFAAIVESKIFARLGMTRTALHQDVFATLVAEGNIAQGYRLSASLNTCTPSQHLYLSSSLEAGAFGGRSCTDDLATLFQDLFAAIDDSGKVFSKDMARYFFGTWTNSPTANPTLCGLHCALDSAIPGSESLNIYSGSPRDLPALGTLDDESVYVHYKGGTLDGFTSCVYVSVEHRTVLVVLTNGVGPVDFAEYAACHILQEVFELRPIYNISLRANTEKTEAQKHIGAIEHSDSAIEDWPDNIEPFAGEYEHVIHRQRLNINLSGDIVFKSESSCSQPMRVFASGSKVRIFPGKIGFVVDRRSAWKDLEFEKVRRQNDVFLVATGGIDYYKRL